MAASDERTSPPSPWLVALVLFTVTLVAFLATADAATLRAHTPFNHYALLAEGFLHGRLHLDGPPPDYTQYNDFAVHDQRWWVSFPPAPAVLITPLVALSGSAEATRDGLFFIVVGALTPALLFLALARLAEEGLSHRTWRENALLSLSFAFGTVYWFSAVQGTVWFAGHAVATLAAMGYLFASISAKRPALAGLCLAVALATRPSLALAAPLFALELARTSRRPGATARAALAPLARFLAPLACVCAALAVYNAARFGSPFEFGHHYLDVVWRPRMDRWGLFSFHYLGRNLGVALASTPFVAGPSAFQITGHGLALWLTSPFFAWALFPRAMPSAPRALHLSLVVTVVLVALVDLAYHNTGWVQFGYRFSNDWAGFLIAMIALGRRRLGAAFSCAVALAVVVNGFGAVTFARPRYARFYVSTPVDTIFEPDLPAPPARRR
jgi:hypothetical protein